MGIRFYCPNGHKLNVKEFQAGRRGICPFCDAGRRFPRKARGPAARAAVARQGTRPFTKMTTRRRPTPRPISCRVNRPVFPAIRPEAKCSAPASRRTLRP